MAASRKLRRVRMTLLSVAAASLAAASALGAWQWWHRWREGEVVRLLQEGTANVEIDAEMESRIKAFCGDCHALPRPESFHRDAWHDEVELGYSFYVQSARTDLAPPPMDSTVAYFRSRAPEELSYPEPKEADTKFRASFTLEKVELDASATSPPAIAGLRWAKLRADSGPMILASDMQSGEVTALDPADPQRRVRRLARVDNACHIEPCDLERDGSIGLLVADLGSCTATDHDRGRVVWLRQDQKTGQFETVVLASGLGRVADVRPIDTSGTGKLDLIVAEFGWRRTGSIRLLRNVSSPGGPLRFQPELLDPRTGTIHVPVCDLNQDGRPDFVALVSNESESVDVFLNQGNGKFHRQTLWQAPDLTFGSSGIELVDLNGDGKMDILYANGDAFDNMYLSPWHGVQWLENLGNMRFRYHRLTDMPGVCVALAGDFDGDGDPDILAVSYLPLALKPKAAAARQFPSIVLLEQTSPGHFVRHTLEKGFACHAAAVVGDFNHDGRLDFAVGTFWASNHGLDLGRTWLTVWWNRGTGSGK
jgi:hypothetical protein